MLYDDILGMGLEVAELAGEALDLDAMLAGHVDAELDLGGEDVPALRAENAGGEAALRTPVMLDVHVVPVQGELTRVQNTEKSKHFCQGFESSEELLILLPVSLKKLKIATHRSGS